MLLIIIIALIFLIGYSSQRTGVCMVRAMNEVIERRRGHRLAGFLLAAATAMMVMAAAEYLGARPFTTILGARTDWIAIAGGVLYGLGSRINGHCAIGTAAALTSGQMSRSASIAAMLVAAICLGPNMLQAALLLPMREQVVSPLAGNVPLALAVGGTLAALAGYYLYRRLKLRRPGGGWSPLLAMALIGAASGALFALDQQWLYTSSIAKIAYGDTPFTFRAIAVPIALIGGMVVAVVIGGMFRLQTGSIREWARAAAGGLLMGIGATFVPGGNDTMLFTGIPLLLPNLLAAYAAFVVTLYLALYVGRPKDGQQISADV